MRKLVLLVAVAACSGSEYDKLPKQDSQSAPIIGGVVIGCRSSTMMDAYAVADRSPYGSALDVVTVEVAGTRVTRSVTDTEPMVFAMPCVVGQDYDLEITATNAQGESTVAFTHAKALAPD